MKEASTYPLRASVLRRLLDESYDPTPPSPGVLTDLSDSAMKSEEALELGYITPLQLREDLLLDLNYLLQTTRLSTRPLGNRYPEVKASIYYYGLPDRASFGFRRDRKRCGWRRRCRFTPKCCKSRISHCLLRPRVSTTSTSLCSKSECV